jgi:hypothetical protein
MSIMRVVADRRFLAVVVAVGVTGAGLALVAPSVVAAAIPFLIVAACPISMFVMMRSMGDNQSKSSMSPAGSTDVRAHLLDRLAAAQLEQRRLEQELARLESRDPAAVAEPPGRAPASVAASRARSS